MDDLITRIQSLPPELYDLIDADVFTPDTNTDGGVIIRVDDMPYKPPAAMQVDRKTRAFFAQAYHSADTTDIVSLDKLEDRLLWLWSVPKSYQAQLLHTSVVVSCSIDTLKRYLPEQFWGYADLEELTSYSAAKYSNELKFQLRNNGVSRSDSDHSDLSVVLDVYDADRWDAESDLP